jgi:hypothetical protein
MDSICQQWGETVLCGSRSPQRNHLSVGLSPPIFLYGGPLILAGENGNAPHDYTPPLIDHCVVNFDANTSPRSQAARRDMIDRWEAHSNSSIDYPRVGGGSQEVCQCTWNSNQKEGSPCRYFQDASPIEQTQDLTPRYGTLCPVAMVGVVIHHVVSI